MAQNLEALAGGPALVIQVADQNVTISPIRVKELAAFARAVRPVADMFIGDKWAQTNDGIFLALVENPKALIQSTAIGARMPEEWVAGLSIPELVRLAGAIVAVNTDFFVRAVMPEVKLAADRVIASMMAGSDSLPG